ncbi:MAG: N-acetylmuramoyl-L-alanine amidase, partial [Desulfoferrobacter sp.]
GIALASPVDKMFDEARKKYYAGLSLPQEQQPDALKERIEEFQRVLDKDSRKKYTDKCLYLIAQSYHRLYDDNPTRQYLKEAQKYYRMLVHELPESPLADDAQYLLGIIYLEEDPSQAYLEFIKVGIYFPQGDMRLRAAEKAQQLKAQLNSPKKRDKNNLSGSAPAFAFASGSAASPSLPSNSPKPAPSPKMPTDLNQLKNIQHWAGDDYTRVALYVSEPVNFERHDLPAEPKIGLPDRIYIDLKNCTVDSSIEHNVSIEDRFLKRMRVAQYDPTQVRIALDVEDMRSYKIFSLADPYRLIIDVQGKKSEPVESQKPKEIIIPKGSQTSTLARQLGLQVGRIVIDPGHGGKDKGAISPNGLFEKDVVLAIAKRLKKDMESTLGCEVILTRTNDRFLSLEERTAMANAQKADLFISIHTNAHEDRNLHGTETYFLNLSNDKESARVAALENATSTRRISDLENILKDIMLNTKINESAKLAKTVQSNLIRNLKKNYDRVKDLGVKQAPFYVLLGAEMPSVLIETAFITNKNEERRLLDKNFQRSLVAGISSGIGSYIQQMKQFANVGGAR